jgi:pectate lyase
MLPVAFSIIMNSNPGCCRRFDLNIYQDQTRRSSTEQSKEMISLLPSYSIKFICSLLVMVPALTSAGDSTISDFLETGAWQGGIEGGRGGRIVRVTTLDNEGPGSLRAALTQTGPSIIVFEVGGVIDLQKRQLEIVQPRVSIAGQTAPSPGITLIRGGISVRTHDVIIQHLRIRPGEAGQSKRSGWGVDALSTSSGAHRVWIDHCSLTWGTDENLSASGRRFGGKDVKAWRNTTSHDIVFSFNLIAEGLSNSTHSKGEHSKGMLLHDNVTGVLLLGNLFAHNQARNPLLKGAVRATLVNNFIYDPGVRAVHYNLLIWEWGEREVLTGQLSAVGNVLRAGPSTSAQIAFLMLGGSGDLKYFGKDNVAVDRLGNPLPMLGRYTTSAARIIEQPAPMDWPEGLEALPSKEVEAHALKFAGARPWDRDEHDLRVISNVEEGRGRIIDSEQEVGGYPLAEPSHRAFDEMLWDLETLRPRSTKDR